MSNKHSSRATSHINVCIIMLAILIISVSVTVLTAFGTCAKKINYIKDQQNAELLQLKADLISGKGFVEIRQEDGIVVRYIVEPTVHREIQTFIPVGNVK